MNHNYEVDGVFIETNPEMNFTLNALSRRLYLILGYEVDENYDFSVATHPQEVMVYRMALEAYAFNINS